MSDLVPEDIIESMVGATRHKTLHIARVSSKVGRVYILHSLECRRKFADLTQCPYSLALDEGLDDKLWQGQKDQAIPVIVSLRGLAPLLWKEYSEEIINPLGSPAKDPSK